LDKGTLGVEEKENVSSFKIQKEIPDVFILVSPPSNDVFAILPFCSIIFILKNACESAHLHSERSKVDHISFPSPGSCDD